MLPLRKFPTMREKIAEKAEAMANEEAKPKTKPKVVKSKKLGKLGEKGKK